MLTCSLYFLWLIMVMVVFFCLFSDVLELCCFTSCVSGTDLMSFIISKTNVCFKLVMIVFSFSLITSFPVYFANLIIKKVALDRQFQVRYFIFMNNHNKFCISNSLCFSTATQNFSVSVAKHTQISLQFVVCECPISYNFPPRTRALHSQLTKKTFQLHTLNMQKSVRATIALSLSLSGDCAHILSETTSRM